MELSNLRPAEGSKHSDNFRRGRGHGSGNGKTAGKGHKGQLARSGHKKPGFEGGQMPLYRRLPKRGFKNRNTKEIIAINVDVLNRFEDGAEEAKMIMTKKVEKMGNFMDNLFAFHKLYLEGKLEPPKIGVVSEPVQITKDGKVMIIQQEYMEIIEPAKFVNQPKTWQNFILD